MALPKPLITRSDKVMSGAVVFAGIRVTVQTLLDYLEEGDTLDGFLKDFPTVSREHAIAVLELAKESVLAHASSPVTLRTRTNRIEPLRPLVPEVLRVIEGIPTLGRGGRAIPG